jgi:aspartyl protease family protein
MDSATNQTRLWGRGMIYLMWAVVLAGLTALFSELNKRDERANQIAGVDASGRAQLVLSRNRHGQYLAQGAINGQPVRFLLDTGASDVNVPIRIARRLELELGAPLSAQTANGTITVYATRIEEISLGPLSLRGVKASVNPKMHGDEVLLGMSFLRHLEFEQKQGVLTLRHAR